MILTNNSRNYTTHFKKFNLTPRRLFKFLLIICAVFIIKEGIFRNWSFAYNYSESLPGKFFIYKKDPNSIFGVGDLVVFRVASDDIFYPDKQFLKIVAGKEGDIVEVNNREYVVNGYRVEAKEFSKRNIRLDNYIPLSNIIAKDHFFVIGLHLDSYDSRYMGTIPQSNIIGKAWRIF